MRFITAEPRRGAAAFTGYAIAADPLSAIGDLLVAWQATGQALGSFPEVY